MSICHATEYDIQLFSRNKLCTFYVVRDAYTEKYHVFVVVYPDENMKDQRGYIMSTHDEELDAKIQKSKYARTFKNGEFFDPSCHATGWYRDNILN